MRDRGDVVREDGVLGMIRAAAVLNQLEIMEFFLFGWGGIVIHV